MLCLSLHAAAGGSHVRDGVESAFVAVVCGASAVLTGLANKKEHLEPAGMGTENEDKKRQKEDKKETKKGTQSFPSHQPDSGVTKGDRGTC